MNIEIKIKRLKQLDKLKLFNFQYEPNNYNKIFVSCKFVIICIDYDYNLIRKFLNHFYKNLNKTLKEVNNLLLNEKEINNHLLYLKEELEKEINKQNKKNRNQYIDLKEKVKNMQEEKNFDIVKYNDLVNEMLTMEKYFELERRKFIDERKAKFNVVTTDNIDLINEIDNVIFKKQKELFEKQKFYLLNFLHLDRDIYYNEKVAEKYLDDKSYEYVEAVTRYGDKKGYYEYMSYENINKIIYNINTKGLKDFYDFLLTLPKDEIIEDTINKINNVK